MRRPLSDAQFERRCRQLRDRLLEAQFDLRQAGRGSVAFIVTGTPASGRTETVRELVTWLDQKYIEVHAADTPDAADKRRPPLWRHWQVLPRRGRIAVYFNGWYADFLLPAMRAERAMQTPSRAARRIRGLEAMLSADGMEIVKVHLHVAPRLQRQRLQMLHADPLTRWRATAEDRWQAEHHEAVARAARRCLKATDHAVARWRSIDGADERRRLLAVGESLLHGLRRAAGKTSATRRQRPVASAAKAAALPSQPPRKSSHDEYRQQLREWQARFAALTRKSQFRKRGLTLVFEGLDAAGKGGAIQRLTESLDVRQFRVLPIAAPSAEELAYPYLWRFWRHVPELGSVAVFDRSWYGRVLVERVRGFAAPSEWNRAYQEINEFEAELTEHGLIVCKFWLSVSKEEQLKRFKKRDANPLKRFKVDPEDWKNRRYYDQYQGAVRQMLARTDKPAARWTLVEADDKQHARIKILSTVCRTVEGALG